MTIKTEYAEFVDNRALREAVNALVEDGLLQNGPEGMSEAQSLFYQAYLLVAPSVIVSGPKKD